MSLTAAATAPLVTAAQNNIDYSATVYGQASSGALAPYFIGSGDNGRSARRSSAMADLRVTVTPDLGRRFSWGAGVEVLAGWQHDVDYARWNGSWSTVSNRPAAVWIQQIYGEVKYRGVFLRLGQKDPHSAILDERLTSGDLVRSSNARGIPGAEIGFIDFQNIPFTGGWVQIQGVVEYGKMTDDNFNHDQFNYYSSLWTSDLYYTYKRCYFRTRPSERFSVTLGMQTAGQFGGATARYRRGEIYYTEHRGFRFKDVFRMFFPTQGSTGDGFYEGNSLGSWDFKARYRLNDGSELSFVFQWPWEDGSGIGRRNGWDGLWGLYYNTPSRSIISGAAIEYLDFRNQSGPIHWAPGDIPGTSIVTEATGADDYYNNAYYGAFSNYGLSIGTPFLVSPLYNINGFPLYAHSRARGIHAAVTGNIGTDWDYTVKYSWQQAWGSGLIPTAAPLHDNSMMVGATWNAHTVAEGLRIDARAAFDAGDLRGDNFGFLIGVTYSGDLSFKK